MPPSTGGCASHNDACVMQGEAMLQKQHEVQSSAIHALFQGVPPALVSYLDIQVRRDNILEDSLNQIRVRRQDRREDLKKPLRVTFISNGVAEEGQDEGGLSKEFFQLLVQKVNVSGSTCCVVV